jgi:hypothetical protein
MKGWSPSSPRSASSFPDCSIRPSWRASTRPGLRDLMARMGHDSERAAMIYQHEARGADQAITSAIDTHVQAEQRNDDDDDGPAGVLAP